ncbi:MAG: hypothetical protein KF901_02465 [Myxococcales bacterium]|nr:hypothetical protein [Myxococcales bacterium]
MTRPDTGPGGEVCNDIDRDGHSGRTEMCPSGTDCNDTNAAINPDADELCGNGVDDDCDGEIDEDDCVCAPGQRIGCFSGPAASRNVGACRSGVAVCESAGVPGECRGETTPVEETCNGVDDDCDGLVDEGLRNACGECGAEEPVEQCGNGIDDDCDGRVDEDCECDFRCECVVGTSCECRPPTNQPCYEGPFGTGGVGVCRGGRRDCLEDAASGSTRWGTCVGAILPGVECEGGAANGLDDDCDGVVDEGCRDADGDGVPWPIDCDDSDPLIFPGAPERCNDRDDDCDGLVDEGVLNGCGGCYVPEAREICGNGLDDDCNGLVDDGCTCEGGSQSCYGGPPGTAGVGLCAAGTQACMGGEFTSWGACTMQRLPEPEVCDGVDNDCDGEVDERWAIGSNACGFCDGTEICDGLDNDCDGRVDEGVSNACGECGPEPVEICNGVDDDCDGIVDEGVTNACGTCPPEPCFTDIWDRPSECDAAGRECDGVEPHPDFPDSVTLGQSAFNNDFIYIAVTNRDQVAKINTETGAHEWQVATHGACPSRTAVALDGSVWVGNRALVCRTVDANNTNNSNVVHLRESDGSVICRAPVPGGVRGLAVDANGDVWAGTWNGQRVFKISGTIVDPAPPGVPFPVCRILGDWSAGHQVYGLAADSDGYVWTAGPTRTSRFDIATGAGSSYASPRYYGVAADGEGNLWFGGWNGSGNVHRIRRSDGAQFNTSVNNVTAVTVHPDGTVWGSRYGTNQVVRIDPATGNALCTGNSIRSPGVACSGDNCRPHGIAVDRRGRIWSPNRYGGYVNVYDQNTCALLHSYPVDPGQELYSYSDMTGHLLRTFIAPEGWWRQIFDSGYATPYWTTLEWDSVTPAGTGIEMFARVADTEAGLDAATACGPFTTSPADLSVCGFGRHRYLRIDARLFRTGTEERPILHEARAFWAY